MSDEANMRVPDLSCSGAEPSDAEARASLRSELLARFAAYLDEALAGPTPPAGLLEHAAKDSVPGAGTDSYSLFASLTALTQEVKLQGRAFKRLDDRIAPLAAETSALDAALRDLPAALTGARREGKEEAERGHVHLLVDLLDRIHRGCDGLEDAERMLARVSEPTAAPSWLARVLRRGTQDAALTALRNAADVLRDAAQAYAIGTAWLTEQLTKLGVSETPCLGLSFDPKTMRAIDVESVPGAQGDTVVCVYRRGYTRGGSVLRLAEVKVERGLAGAAPRPSPSANPSSSTSAPAVIGAAEAAEER
jgi:hypothetical protein